jgi:hypothetical protein
MYNVGPQNLNKKMTAFQTFYFYYNEDNISTTTKVTIKLKAKELT